MTTYRPLLLAALVATAFAHASNGAELVPDPPKTCSRCAAWNRAIAPFRLYGNTWYVGVAGVGSVLIASDDGLILIDGGLPQSAPVIAQNIRTLGFRVEDIKFIATSHAHWDHVGGVAALARASGAQVVGSERTAQALEAGSPPPDDPQYGFGPKSIALPKVPHVRIVADGEAVRVGGLAVTAHYTPGHTPGATTWTWRSCVDKACLDMVYADSLNAVADDDYRYTGKDGAPGIADGFRRSIATVAALPCDVIVAAHPEMIGLEEKLARRAQGESPDPFIARDGCKRYADAAAEALDARVADEQKSRATQ